MLLVLDLNLQKVAYFQQKFAHKLEFLQLLRSLIEADSLFFKCGVVRFFVLTSRIAEKAFLLTARAKNRLIQEATGSKYGNDQSQNNVRIRTWASIYFKLLVILVMSIPFSTYDHH